MTSTLRLRPFGLSRVWAPTGEQSAALDRRAIREIGVPQTTLMENAGRSAAMVLERLFPRGEVRALVGSGNNGGDALVLLRTLAAWGRPVRAILVADRGPGGELAHGWEVPTWSDQELDGEEAWDRALEGSGVLVDGLLGTGIRGAPRERQARGIRALNRGAAPVLALDVPSGVDADTGAVPGEAVEARATVAFGWPKLGTLLHPGRARVGRLLTVEIGFPPPAVDHDFAAELVTPAWAQAHGPVRTPDAHKNAVGSLLVVAGRSGMAGAAVLAVRSALRSGVGLVRVASPPANREILQETVPEAIFVDASDPAALDFALEASDAVAAGPGMGTDTAARDLLGRVLASGDGPLVLDADALNLCGAGEAPSLEALGGKRKVLVTPHPGEMERITDLSRDEILGDRPGVARRTAASTGCTVLLKGLPSLVASPGGRLLLDTVGTSDLASAGMGDVLTGACGSFLAQGMPPPEAGALALHRTGRAAVRADRGSGLVPNDVVDAIPDALREQGRGDTELELPFLVFDQDPAR